MWRRICGFLLGLFCAVSFTQAAKTHQYTFNNGPKDSVGTVDGTLVNGATVTGGQLVFDAVTNNGSNTDPAMGQYMSLPSNILKTPDFTIEAWCTTNGGLPWQRILDFGNAETVGGGIVEGRGFIILTTNGIGQINPPDLGTAGDAVGGQPLTTGVQHHMVYTHSHTAGKAALYIDGRLIASGRAHIDPSAMNYTHFWIGRSQFSVDPFFCGSINEIRIYDDAMTKEEVMADFQAGPTVGPDPARAGMPAAVMASPGTPVAGAATASAQDKPADLETGSGSIWALLGVLVIGGILLAASFLLQRKRTARGSNGSL